ncbi:MAG: TetR/AcrR family transcriptional regulator [Congregibacter sp.]
MSTATNYHHGDLRRALLAAAEEELSAKGVETFSLRSVAKRAGVSHGAPAHHFGDTRGLLTQLAALGYQRFIDTQEQYQLKAKKNPKAQLAASGLGYIAFATNNPALFRLMFSSDRPDKTSPTLSEHADAAFDKLVADIQQITETDPYIDRMAMTDVMAAWAIAHGLADLMIAGRWERIPFLAGRTPMQRDAVFSDIILRACSDESK